MLTGNDSYELQVRGTTGKDSYELQVRTLYKLCQKVEGLIELRVFSTALPFSDTAIGAQVR
jgi:hypothetical protein